MAKVPVGLRLEPEMIAAVDRARGDVPRVRWIERAIEAALDQSARASLARRAMAGAPANVRTSASVKAGVKPIARGTR